MGEIRKRLGDIATYFDKEQLAVRCQLEYAGEAIESEFEKLYTMLAQRTKRIEALENPEKVFPDVPTGKNEPKFQIGDTIAFWGIGDIRIVLETKPNNFHMKLMDVPSGNIQWTHCQENYTLVYRHAGTFPN